MKLCLHLILTALLFVPSIAVYSDEDIDISFDDELGSLETKSKPAAAGIDLDATLNRLETVPVDDYLTGSWGSDIQRWNESAAASDDQKKQDKLAEIKSRCTCFWDKSQYSCQSRPTLTLTSTPVSAWHLAHEYCRKGNSLKTRADGRRFEDCRHDKALKIEEQRESEARENRAKQRREAENARRRYEASRTYCAAAKTDVAAGNLPTSGDPGWTPVDEQEFRNILDNFDDGYKSRVNEIEAKHEGILQGRREQDERDAAADSLRAERVAKAAAVKAKHDQWCQIELGLGHAPCGCDLPPEATACDK